MRPRHLAAWAALWAASLLYQLAKPSPLLEAAGAATGTLVWALVLYALYRWWRGRGSDDEKVEVVEDA